MVSFSSTIEVGETPALAQDRARHLHKVNTMTVGDVDMVVAMMKINTMIAIDMVARMRMYNIKRG